MPFINTEVEVYVDLADLTDEELLEEIDRRDLTPRGVDAQVEQVVRDIYQRRQLRLGYEPELEDLFDLVLGRLV